jgi:class 3 adenylate cyclase
MGNEQETEEYSVAERSILFSDIVPSTTALERVGNRRWSDVIRHHRRSIGAVSHRRRGQVIGFTGDGFMVAFEREIDAVDCALRLAHQSRPSSRCGRARSVTAC